MPTYTKQTEVYRYTETVYYKDGVELFRERNHDDEFYDTDGFEDISEEDADELGIS